jgi:cell division protein FtsW
MSRADTSRAGLWWWSIDRWTLTAVAMLVFAGYVMLLAVPPARVTDARDLIILKQVIYLTLSAGIVLAVSLLTPRGVRRLALALFCLAFMLTILTLVMGQTQKGAARWIYLLPRVTIQPSEFLKPCFAVATAWLLTEGKRDPGFPGLAVALALMGMIGCVLVLQPDMGMLGVVAAVFLVQLFISGLRMVWVSAAGIVAGIGSVLAYMFAGHFRTRLNDFLFPSVPTCKVLDQICMSLQGFGNGGLLGLGPGEGSVKERLPDGHSDFVFAVVGEEFGLIVCIGLVCLFAFIVLRGLVRLLNETDMFVVTAVAGLVSSFGLQAFVNMASSLGLIPTKGMTMPFVSYGGSSVLAVALGIGMLLALTRRGQRMEVL